MVRRGFQPSILLTLFVAACASPVVPTTSAPPSIVAPPTPSAVPAATVSPILATIPPSTLAATPPMATATTQPAVPTPTGLDCAPADAAVVNRGALTVGFSEPAVPPWFGGDAPISYPGEPEGTAWEVSDPYSAEGFESALAYALGAQLRFARESVQWLNIDRAAALAPGPKPFDLYLSQANPLHFSPNVYSSREYYEVNYAILGLFANPIAEVTTADELRAFTLGAVESSPAWTLLSQVVQPTTPVSAFSSLVEARAALEIGDIDGLAIDLPTAFRLRDEEIPGAVVVGQFEATHEDLGIITAEPAGYSAILPRDSEFAGCLDGALEVLEGAGTIDTLRHAWLADRANAPILE